MNMFKDAQEKYDFPCKNHLTVFYVKISKILTRLWEASQPVRAVYFGLILTFNATLALST